MTDALTYLLVIPFALVLGMVLIALSRPKRDGREPKKIHSDDKKLV